ncbi:MAG: dTDP-4-dehydrorhamnose 3,5-epimerase [Armatimonadota bacterium]|nr:dTDP-4-dehydrorhamnose 3,5-epimerase [Armatimonadota bacterium]MDR7443291.1 dTDP-4-dehydrorhamnose 3,5-epimerase [Armatimonadota bacterium]MDR7569958.1 dTDP-4-dehydrorhamnose 3,5-epimerase [Armatimonadota bacterium]MDR7614379.1 dTDP-4-dehydrorhamnose 3,5-epimerase [Armatimonadota bacterium]
MPFVFLPLEIPDVVLIRARAFPDARGFFLETYRRSEFERHGIPVTFVQDNFSRSVRRGILRGLHYQKAPRAQGKLVMVLRGAIYDVAVDIRRGSPTYGRWVAVTLSEQEHTMLYVPPGFAHGFCVLSEGADVLYKCTEEYDPALDRGIRWDDPDLGIPWPVKDPLLSEKDRAWPPLREADHNFVYGFPRGLPAGGG